MYENEKQRRGKNENQKNARARACKTAFYLTIRLRARVFYEADSQRGAAELTIARRKRGRVV